jgi:predicted ArsR family transcriptional regulator
MPMKKKEVSPHLRDAFAILRALRDGPASVEEIAERTGVHWRKVYRLVHELVALETPIREAPGEGRQPARFSLSAAGVRQFFGARR